MLRFQLFPRSIALDDPLRVIVGCFEQVYDHIGSPENVLDSNGVLRQLKPHLQKAQFKVETGKSKGEKIPVPVLFGLNDRIDKSFSADAISHDGRIVVEVEAGRAVANYQFLKDIFQASMMHGVEYLVLAVRNDYRGSEDFQKARTFLETMYVNGRLRLPLKGILLVGY